MDKPLSQEEVIKLAVNEAVKAARRQFKLEEEKARAKQKDRRLHNTKLLVQNYRLFKLHAENAVFSAAECEDSVFDILAMMSDKEFAKAESTVSAIKNSATRTAVIVKHIDAMIEMYKIWCERSDKIENMRRYRVLYALYISDDIKSSDEISEVECVDIRTIYRDVNAAIDVLSSLIFGVEILEV